MDPLSILRRNDKWFLGGGKGALYAPPFPKHLVIPGFWDECYFADIRLPRLFTVLFTDIQGKPVRLNSKVMEWRPDFLTIHHQAEGLEICERRCVTQENAWVSEFRVLMGEQVLNAFVWALPEVKQAGYGTPWSSSTELEVRDQSITDCFQTAWPSEVEADRSAIEVDSAVGSTASMMAPVSVFLEVGASVVRESFTVNLAQRHDESPLYELSVLPEKLVGGKLPNEFKYRVGSEPIEGLVHAVQQFKLEKGNALVVACGSGLTAESANQAFEKAIEPGVVDRSTQGWRGYFASVPQFESSDPWLTQAYWNRWFGLRLNTVDLAGLSMSGKPSSFSPFVTEGIGFFRNFVTYSAQAHLRETSWSQDRSVACGILENLVKTQREDGSFPGHTYSARPARDFYHADFATGLEQYLRLHDKPMTDSIGDALERYASYFLNSRWCSEGALVFDQNETGQEYMSRYQFVTEDADQWVSFRVAGVDATTYLLSLLRLLKDRVSDPVGREAWSAKFQMVKAALENSFNFNDSFFQDRKPGSEASPERPATGFYPLMMAKDLAGIGLDQFEKVLEKWLLSPDQFWLEKGFPATAKSDRTYRADGEWKDRRLNCPWNGRSWPMANSHLVDAIANVGRLLEDEPLRIAAGQALMKAIRLMFHTDDASRPNSFEHYNAETGVPALYRGYDDYMHSWIVDLILRHAVGVQPGLAEVDPLPMGIAWVRCTGIPNCGRLMDVYLEAGKTPIVNWEK